MNKKIIFEYDDRSFKEAPVNELKESLATNKDFSIRKIKQKSLDLYPIFLIVFGPPIFWFSKGFFTKMGEDAYETIKKKVSKILLNRNTEKPPLLEIEIAETPNILLYLKSDDEQVISTFLDDVSSNYQQIREHLENNLEADIKKFVVTLKGDGKRIEDCYYITEKNEVFSMVETSETTEKEKKIIE